MLRRKETKTAALVLSLIVLALCLVPADPAKVGIYAGCPWTARLTYSFFHAGILHAALNAWCLLSIVFIYDVSILYLFIAYLIAIAYPVNFSFFIFHFSFFSSPTLGLSAVCFALLGIVSCQTRRRAYYHACCFAMILVGFFLPAVNAVIHLYAYLSGLIIALLNTPLNTPLPHGRGRGRVFY